MNEQIKRQEEQREGQSNWNEGKRERERENKVWKGKKMKRLGSLLAFWKEPKHVLYLHIHLTETVE